MLKRCIANCGVGQFSDPITNVCVNACPPNYYGDVVTKLCMAYEFECKELFCINPDTHLCIGMGANYNNNYLAR